MAIQNGKVMISINTIKMVVEPEVAFLDDIFPGFVESFKVMKSTSKNRSKFWLTGKSFKIEDSDYELVQNCINLNRLIYKNEH